MVRTPRQCLLHLFSGPWWLRRHFNAEVMQRIGDAITQSEQQHSGQIRVVVEPGLHPKYLIGGKTPAQRARELFSSLEIWDTAQNNGVLIYLLLADRDVEIVADRGIYQPTSQETWDAICRQMELLFRRNEFEQGVKVGIDLVGRQLRQYFPADAPGKNELPDQPIIL